MGLVPEMVESVSVFVGNCTTEFDVRSKVLETGGSGDTPEEMLGVDDFAVRVGAELVWGVSDSVTDDTKDDVDGKPGNVLAGAWILPNGFVGTDDDIGG